MHVDERVFWKLQAAGDQSGQVNTLSTHDSELIGSSNILQDRVQNIEMIVLSKRRHFWDEGTQSLGVASLCNVPIN